MFLYGDIRTVTGLIDLLGVVTSCTTLGAYIDGGLARQFFGYFGGGLDAYLDIALRDIGGLDGDQGDIRTDSATTYCSALFGDDLYDNGDVLGARLLFFRFGFYYNAGLSGYCTTYRLYGALLGFFAIGIEYYYFGLLSSLDGSTLSDFLIA